MFCIQEKVTGLEEKSNKINGASDTWQLEKMRLIAISDEKTSQIDQLRKDNQAQLEQIDHMRKEVLLIGHVDTLFENLLIINICNHSL